jgi:hypothetical protein
MKLKVEDLRPGMILSEDKIAVTHMFVGERSAVVKKANGMRFILAHGEEVEVEDVHG